MLRSRKRTTARPVAELPWADAFHPPVPARRGPPRGRSALGSRNSPWEIYDLAAELPTDALLAAEKGGRLTSTNPQNSINSLRQLIQEHRQKIEDYLKNPNAFDNQGLLKNAPPPEIRQKIIDGRVKHLEKESRAFEKNIKDLGGTP